MSNGKETPEDSISHTDHAGHLHVDTWNYNSVISKLKYLANSTRPDIIMAVHQCT